MLNGHFFSPQFFEQNVVLLKCIKLEKLHTKTLFRAILLIVDQNEKKKYENISQKMLQIVTGGCSQCFAMSSYWMYLVFVK